MNALATLLPLVLALYPAQPSPAYRLTVLDAALGETMASRIDDVGGLLYQVVTPAAPGACFGPIAQFEARYRFPDGRSYPLPSVSSTICYASIAEAYRSNARGAIVGQANASRPFFYEGGFYRELASELAPLRVNPYDTASVADIDAHGRMAASIGFDAALFDGARWVKLTSGAAEARDAAVAMNDAGAVLIETSGPYGFATLGVWKHGSFTPVTPVASAHATRGVGINDAGAIVGTVDGRAFVVDGATITLLDAGGLAVTPTGINAHGTVIGTGACAAPSSGTCAYVARARDGRWIDLDTLAAAGPWHLSSATSINAAGIVVGLAENGASKRAYFLRPGAETASMYLRGGFIAGGAAAMTLSEGRWEAHVHAPSGGASFTFDVANDGVEAYGAGADGFATRGGSAIAIAGGDATITFDTASKAYTVTPVDPIRRTIVFMYGVTQPGQDMFVRGGIDHDYARVALGRACASDNGACAIPIEFKNTRNAYTAPYRQGDSLLDWYGAQPWQGRAGDGRDPEGTPMEWTTNAWPASFGPKRTVDVDGFGETPLNVWGSHYWMLDVAMDCTRTVDGWFEVKSFISHGPGWEADVAQAGAPYASRNHFAKCGHVNVFRRGESAAMILPLPL